MNLQNKISAFFADHTESVVLILALILSVGSFFYYYDVGFITAYGDSKAHLDIARRVVDALTPGAAQLGGYWLPLLHILMFPTIWNDFMWQSGLSGAIPNMISFVIAVVLMYRLVLYVTKDKLSAFIGASVLLFNPNLLYMQATPMTESLFIMTIVGFMYFFYRWFHEKKLSDLIFAAIFLILASLNRYEGWGLVIAANVLMVWYWAQMKFDKKIEGAMIAFAILSFLGIFLWLLWGLVIFHDPLAFLHNDLSAGKLIINEETWTGLHNVYEAVMVNIYAIFHTSGVFLFAAIPLGLFVFLAKNGRAFYKSENLILFLLIVPMLFDTLTVYTGKVPIEVPELSKIASPGNYFNIRYALYSLPFIAIFIAFISKKRIIQISILALILLNYSFLSFYRDDNIVVLMDAGTQKHDTEDHKWFKENYHGGLILASTGSSDGFMLETGISQKNFITEGSYKYWDESLEDPAKYATWVILSDNYPRDLLNKKINKELLFDNFEVVNSNKDFMILKKIEKNSMNITADKKNNQNNQLTASTTKYVVEKGDNLWMIANKYYDSGLNWKIIYQENNLTNPDLIYPQDVLNISNK